MVQAHRTHQEEHDQRERESTRPHRALESLDFRKVGPEADQRGEVRREKKQQHLGHRQHGQCELPVVPEYADRHESSNSSFLTQPRQPRTASSRRRSCAGAFGRRRTESTEIATEAA